MDSTTRRPPPGDLRPAATLVLLRDSPRGLEVLLTLRPKAMRFMGGATVFPGGAVAPEDSDPRWETGAGLTRDEAAARLDGDGEKALALFVCALREAHEEVGFVFDVAVERALEREGAAAAPFVDRCLAAGVEIGAGSLVPAGRWLTPFGSTVRFDTYFFLARAPAGWEPKPAAAEVERVEWSTPEHALEDFAAGRRAMAPPTTEMLQRLSAFDSVDDALSRLPAAPLSPEGFIYRARLGPAVEVVLAPNPGVMTGPGTNTYIVGSGPKVVIDPAVDDARYLATVMDAGAEIDAILITHRHSDHIGGVGELADRTGARVRAYGDERISDVVVDSLSDGETIAVPGARLTALHCPGHASDHMCFFNEDDHSLFAGDNVLGEGTSVIAPPDGDMAAYLATLERLRGLRVGRIYCGHFRPLDDGAAVLNDYIDHRRAREAAIVAALGSDALSISEIVERAYDDTPQYLHAIAELSAQAHLEMLRDEGRARELPTGWARGDVE